MKKPNNIFFLLFVMIRLLTQYLLW